MLPTTHAFAAARAVVAGHHVPWGQLGMAAVGGVTMAAASAGFVTQMLRVFRARGYISRHT